MSELVFPIYAHVHTVKGPPQGKWTTTDWEALPDDGNRYEIIDGELYMSTAPSYFHQTIILRFYRLLGIPAEDQGLAYANIAPIGVFMPGITPVQPDFVLVMHEHADIIYDRRIWGVPDLIVEVLSPGSRDYDEDVKLKAYARAGLPEYAVIDPEMRQLRLYQTPQDGTYPAPISFEETDNVTFTCLPTISFIVGKLFEGSPDTTL